MKLVWPYTAIPPVDPEEQKAIEVAMGLRCGDPECGTLRIGAGCECERQHLFARSLLEAVLFADRKIGEFNPDPGRASRAAVSNVLAAAHRASRRYGVPLPEGFGARIRDRYGVEPRYHPPRVHEANHLPV